MSVRQPVPHVSEPHSPTSARVGLKGWLVIVCLVLTAGQALSLVGCTGGDVATGAGAPAGADGGAGVQDTWMYQVVANPALLAPMEKQGTVGNAWLSLYHNDLGAAISLFGTICTPSEKSYADRAADGFPCVGQARGHLEKGRTILMGAEIDRVARRQFYAHRRARPEEVLKSFHEDYFEGLILMRSGEKDAGKALLQGYAGQEGADPLLAALAQKISSGYDSDPLVARIWGDSKVDAPAGSSLGELPSSDVTAGYEARLVVMEAVAKGDAATALANLHAVRAKVADLLEKLEQTRPVDEQLEVSLFHFDSAFLRSLARWHALSALDSVGGVPDLALLAAEADKLLGREVQLPANAPSIVDGLAFVVFSEWLSPADRLADLRGDGRPASLVHLGAGAPGLLISPRDKLSDLDAFVRLSNVLKGQMTDAIRGLGPEGGNMDAGMGLSERFLGRLLLDGAKDLQRGLDIRLDGKEGADMELGGVSARSLLEGALDKNPAPPSQTLRDARISFRNDPTLLMALAQANLDTKRPYYANDYVRPLTEVYQELIPVRDGLAALDSAWNPKNRGVVR